MSEFRWVEARPIRVRSVRFNGHYEDLPAEARASGFLELNEFGWVMVHTPNGPARLHDGHYLVIGTAAEYYPIPPAIHDYKYWPAGGEG